MNKAAQTNDTIAQHTSVFDNLYSQNIVGNFASLQQTTQKIKDEYHSLFSKSVDELSKKYIQLKADVEALISEINLLPRD